MDLTRAQRLFLRIVEMTPRKHLQKLIYLAEKINSVQCWWYIHISWPATKLRHKIYKIRKIKDVSVFTVPDLDFGSLYHDVTSNRQNMEGPYVSFPHDPRSNG